MASEELSPDYLKKLSRPSEFTEEVDDLLPALLSDIESNSTSSHFSQVVTALLGPIFKQSKIEDVENQLLRYVLPSLGRIFSQSLSSMVETLQNPNLEAVAENVTDVLTSFSQVCLHILTGYNDLLCNLLTYESVTVRWVMSLPRSVCDILMEAFIHCRDSETNYKSLFSTFSDFLTTFFRHTYEVQANFFKVLENILTFSSSLEDELCLLTDVLEAMWRIGEIVVRLDTKAMADQFKTYAKFAHKYASALRPRLDIARSINFLAETLQDTVLIISKEPLADKKTHNRNIKLGSFILKIIIKFCEEYEGYLGECHRKILELLITLNGISTQSQNETFTELNQYIIVGAGPLLRHVIGETQFIQEFSKACSGYKSLTSEAKLGLLLLLLNILKKLVNAEAHIKELWWKTPLEENIFNIFSKCSYEIDTNLKVDGANIYTCLISRTAAVIISNETVSHFSQVEKLLISKLFQPDLYEALFAQDLLCLLARLMTGDVCTKQAMYLSGVIVNWPIGHQVRPEFVFVGTTLSRIFPLLSAKSRTAIANKYPLQEAPILWHFLGLQHFISPNLDLSVTQNTCKTLNLFNKTQSLNSYKEVVKVLQILPESVQILIEKGKFQDLTEMSQNLLNIWGSLKNSLQRFEQLSVKEQPSWWTSFFHQMCRATSFLIPYMSNKDNLEILQVMLMATSTCESSCKISIITTLRSLGEVDLKSGEHFQVLCQLVAQLYGILLEDSDPLVKQMAMESFSQFAHITKHEEIVTSTVNNNSCLQKNIAMYLQGQPIVTSMQNNIKELLYYNDDMFSHKCHSIESNIDEHSSEVCSNESDLRPAKKLRKDAYDKEIEIAQQILKDLTCFNSSLEQPIQSKQLKDLCCSISHEVELLKQKL